MLKLRILREGNKAERLQAWTSGQQTLVCSGTCLKESHGISWREGLLPPSSRMSILMSRKTSKGGGRPALMKKQLLTKLK